MDLHFASAWELVADTVPNSEAIIQGDRRIKWGDYESSAARFAAAIEKAGVDAGSKVSLYLWNCPEYLIAQFGSFKHECCPINVNYRYLDDELVYLVDNSDSEVLVFHSSLGDRVARVMDKLPNIKAFVEVDDGGEHVEGSISWDHFVAVEPQARRDRDPSDRYMLYTGGTTGMPKGVMYENHAFAAQHYAQFDVLNLPVPTPTSLQMIPPFAKFIHDMARMISVPCCPLMHGTGMWVGVMPIHHVGGAVVLLEGRSFDAHELLELTEREGVTRHVIVGDAFARPIAKAMEERAAAGTLPDISSVTQVISSGAMWSAEIKQIMTEHMNAVLVDALGSTEGGGYGAVTTDKSGGASTAKFQPADDTLIIDEDGNVIPRSSGGIGLLCSNTAARGYYKDAQKTAAAFREINGGWYVITGDWATHELDGTITLHGRGSNCINSGGEKIYPEEVEEAMKTHADIDDCYVIGIPDERFGNRIIAVAGCTTAANPSEDELRTYLRGKISGYKIPKQILLVGDFRRAPNGKADYGWAKEIAEQNA
ncbi:MAG: AMP-binding protein [Actinomycetota bacterium]|nr:AMP-binding protein [Actinomycetota bacterium]